MRNGHQIFAIVMGCIAAFFLVVAGVGAYWWTHQGRAWYAQGKLAYEEGRTLGPSGDNHMCLDRSLERFGGCGGVGCEIGVLVFFNACLYNAVPDAGFCEGVPAKTEIFDSVFWRQKRCNAIGSDSELCEQLFASAQGYCDGLRARGVVAGSKTGEAAP